MLDVDTFVSLFFFQAEDGIRDYKVTGVQTCALPIWRQIASEAPPTIPWIVPPFVASGAITEIDGKVKVAGKTTFVTHFVQSVLNGSPFLGQPTTKTKVVYLTEQLIVSFRAAMERAGLLGRRDFTVLLWADT